MNKFILKKESKIPFTNDGYKKIVEERSMLLTRRPEAVEHLRKAREMGDLSENGYYKASRAELSFLDARLRRVNRLIKLAVIVVPNGGDTIQIGNKVRLHDGVKEIEFSLVGGYESNPSKKTISHLSPLGSSIINKKSGDTVNVYAPGGLKKYKIVAVTR